ncbi:DUF2235 domain-containing protein [Massilia atriviolacea]|uniref:DUF2235 domain-containing protein n=1 Tax=Massilia atriviolacea TaxID=2495579 RepID=A0A430HFA0_9BURK|nr:DUF2235 domain-containing protein [Massilia atriviolacea]RSZ56177.1 DUF2235 domain-containing protein [Massilia atriviolacea]
MTTVTPKLFPTGGLRALSAKETLQRAKAMNCKIAKSSKPSCTGQIFVGIFFDGTGNNRDNDFKKPAEAARKHSNVVKLYHAYNDDAAAGFFKFYIPGVGTPFPEIGDDAAMFGGPFAWNGENRVIWAFTRLLNAPHLYVNNTQLMDDARSKTITNNMASMFTPPAHRRLVLRTWQDKLKQALKNKKPELELITLSVFGFSRGAAEARAFCNWLFEVLEYKDGGWQLGGIPFRLDFLGIFDTVASVGIPNSLPDLLMEGHQSWADGNMQIHPAIEQCVHFVAGHEVRAAFPLDSVRIEQAYPPNAREVMYPGAHSDLGGGYAPNAVGISATVADPLAIIPGANMYQDARVAGVALNSWSRLPTWQRADLTPATETVRSFNAYMKSAGITSGPVEDVHRSYMAPYLSYRFKYRNDNSKLPFYVRANAADKSYIAITSETFNARLQRKFSAYPIRPNDPKYSLTDAADMQRKLAKAAGLEAQDRNDGNLQQLYHMASLIDYSKITPAMEEFFGNHVHDSMAGFIGMGRPTFFENSTDEYKVNGLGIWRFRKIFNKNG